MKRLLFLLPAVPQPPDSGAKLRNLALLRLAAERFEVDALAFGAADSFFLPGLTRRALAVAEPRPRSTFTRVRQIVRQQVPDVVQRLASDEFRDRLRCLLADGQYDAVQAEGLEMAPYLRLVPAQRRIYDAHNAEFLLQRRASESADGLATRLYSTLQWRRLERFERDVVRGSRLTLAVSEHDANQLLALAGGEARVCVVPSAIDVGAFPFSAPSPEDAPDLLFLGKLDYRPNAEAVRWLIEQVMPQIHARMEAVRLFVVGANPPAWLVAAGQHDPRIAVTGYVSDERPYLQRCAAMVLPFAAAGGSRLKALVAMASGLPLIATRVGMEGLEAEAGEHFVLADSDAEWVNGVCHLFEDSNARRALAERARRLVEQRYDWPSIRPALEAAYAELFP